MIRQVKMAQASVLDRFLGPSEYAHHGHCVVAGQWLMQGVIDDFTGWQRIEGFSGETWHDDMRLFHDWKGGTEVERLRMSGATLYACI